MTSQDKQPPAPRLSAKGKKKADEKFARQAAALRANLKRRHQQRRGQEGNDVCDGTADKDEANRSR